MISAAVLLSLLSGATLKKDELSEDAIYEDHSYNLFRDVEVTARQNVATACSALVAGSLLFAVTEEDFSHTLAPIVIGALVQLIGRPISWKLINSCINLCGPAVG